MPSIDLRVCLVTDVRATRGRPLAEVVAACLEGGVPLVQLRDRTASGREQWELGRHLRALTSPHQARLLVNDRVDVALAVEADGVHLPSQGLPVAVARGLVGPGRLVGVSTHSLAEAAAAAQSGADFVLFGPVYDTPSKEAYGSPQGLPALAAVCERVPIPVVAIGGVTAARAGEVARAGAAGVAVIRALLEADDPAAAAKELVEAWEAASRRGTKPR